MKTQTVITYLYKAKDLRLVICKREFHTQRLEKLIELKLMFFYSKIELAGASQY